MVCNKLPLAVWQRVINAASVNNFSQFFSIDLFYNFFSFRLVGVALVGRRLLKRVNRFAGSVFELSLADDF